MPTSGLAYKICLYRGLIQCKMLSTMITFIQILSVMSNDLNFFNRQTEAPNHKQPNVLLLREQTNKQINDEAKEVTASYPHFLKSKSVTKQNS